MLVFGMHLMPKQFSLVLPCDEIGVYLCLNLTKSWQALRPGF
jgi:hypothetical protein